MTSSKLTPQRIRELNTLARKIDAEEGEDIKRRGREALREHEKIRAVVEALKHQRQQQGVSLDDLARRTGINKPNLSRLESNRNATPTFQTLQRYARALGKAVRIELADAA